MLIKYISFNWKNLSWLKDLLYFTFWSMTSWCNYEIHYFIDTSWSHPHCISVFHRCIPKIGVMCLDNCHHVFLELMSSTKMLLTLYTSLNCALHFVVSPSVQDNLFKPGTVLFLIVFFSRLLCSLHSKSFGTRCPAPSRNPCKAKCLNKFVTIRHSKNKH